MFPVMNDELDETGAYLHVQPSTGLTSAEAAFRLTRFGRNEEPIPTPSLLSRLSSLLPGQGHRQAQPIRRYATVCRDGLWLRLEEALLVPGDLVQLDVGAIVPADCMLHPSDPGSTLMVDESTLTGESMPVTRTARQRLLWVRALRACLSVIVINIRLLSLRRSSRQLFIEATGRPQSSTPE